MARSLAGCNPSRGRGSNYLGPSSRPSGQRDDRDPYKLILFQQLARKRSKIKRLYKHGSLILFQNDPKAVLEGSLNLSPFVGDQSGQNTSQILPFWPSLQWRDLTPPAR